MITCFLTLQAALRPLPDLLPLGTEAPPVEEQHGDDVRAAPRRQHKYQQLQQQDELLQGEHRADGGHRQAKPRDQEQCGGQQRPPHSASLQSQAFRAAAAEEPAQGPVRWLHPGGSDLLPSMPPSSLTGIYRPSVHSPPPELPSSWSWPPRLVSSGDDFGMGAAADCTLPGGAPRCPSQQVTDPVARHLGQVAMREAARVYRWHS